MFVKILSLIYCSSLVRCTINDVGRSHEMFVLSLYFFSIQQVAQTLGDGESADSPYLLPGSPQAPNLLWLKPALYAHTPNVD